MKLSLLNIVTFSLIGLAIIGIIAILIRNKLVPAKDHEGVDPRPNPNKTFIDWMKSYSMIEKGYAFFNVIFTKNGENVNLPGIIVSKNGVFIISTHIPSNIENIVSRRNQVLFYENQKGKIKKCYDFIHDSNFMIKKLKMLIKNNQVSTILLTNGKPMIFNNSTQSLNLYDIKTYIANLPEVINDEEVESIAKTIESNNRFDLVKNKRKFGILPNLWN